jgi:hypothetical protein
MDAFARGSLSRANEKPVASSLRVEVVPTDACEESTGGRKLDGGRWYVLEEAEP